MFEPRKAQQQDVELEQARIAEEQKRSRELNRSIEITKEYVEDEKAYRKGVVTIRDLIAPDSLKINPNFVILGDKYLRTLFVINYPRYISVG